MKRSHLLSTVQSMNFYANTKSYLQLDIIFGRSLNHPYSSFFYTRDTLSDLFAFLRETPKPKQRFLRAEGG